MREEIHLVQEPEPAKLTISVPATGGLAIHHASGIPIVKILWDGTVEVNPAFTIDEAAKAFWDAVIKLDPRNVTPPAGTLRTP